MSKNPHEVTDTERDLAVEFARERFGDNYATIIRIGQRLKGMTAEHGMYQFPDFAQFGGVDEIKDQLEAQCSAKMMKEAEAVAPRIVRYWNQCEGGDKPVGGTASLMEIFSAMSQTLGTGGTPGGTHTDRRLSELKNKALRIQQEMTSAPNEAARADAEQRLARVNEEASTLTTEMLSELTVTQETYKQCALIAYMGAGCVSDEVYQAVVSGQ